jgi:hypothetical protein
MGFIDTDTFLYAFVLRSLPATEKCRLIRILTGCVVVVYEYAASMPKT